MQYDNIMFLIFYCYLLNKLQNMKNTEDIYHNAIGTVPQLVCMNKLIN